MFKKVRKISTKLIVVFVVVSLVASIAGVVGAVMLKSADTQYSAALVDYGFAQGYLGRLGMIVNENRALTRDIVFLTEKAQLDEAYAQIQENAAATVPLLDSIRPTNTSPEAKELFAKIEKELSEYTVVRDQVLELGMQNKQEPAYALWMNTASPMIAQVAADVTTLLDMNVAEGTLVSDQVTASTNASLLVVIGFIFAGLVISLVIAVWMARSISKPVVAVQKAAEQLSKGDLAIYISSNDADEVGQMTNSFAAAATMMRDSINDISRGLNEIGNGNFNIAPGVEYYGEFKNIENSIVQIITSLSDTLGQINEAANQVAAGSDQVSSGAQALSQGATEQASSIEELSATITEISQQVKLNAETAQDARVQSERAGSEVEDSNRHMQDMIVAMNDINAKSAEISKIIKTIEDIAFQTNILALNAAVEAARAGAAGKGFAVVADEVRNLAGKSAEAAKNTTALIEQTVQAVDNGARIADSTAKAMQNVVVGTRDVTQLILGIAEASNNQANSITQVTVGIDQISSVVQTNSATSEESAAASEELNSQANMLKQLISQFQLLQGRVNSVQMLSEPVHTDHFEHTTVATGSSKY